ncbi:MAG TPA: 1,4-alpha-glucan branching protein GlgB [Candidatus Eremiobacteraceae bacterium]|jgi:1,4-alpha-glucan branching enzyme
MMSSLLQDSRVTALIESRSHDPFGILGQHAENGGWEIRAFLPEAQRASVETPDGPLLMDRVGSSALFTLHSPTRVPGPYRIFWERDGVRHDEFDPYCFGPIISDLDLHLFGEGKLREAYRVFGAQLTTIDGVDGVAFTTWAPNAERASVVGDFNGWDGRRHPMRSRGSSGVWELFVPGVAAGAVYKFEFRNRQTGAVLVKSDPFARAYEHRPGTASVVVAPSTHRWTDGAWTASRLHWDWLHKPISCYEVHLGSWRRHGDGSYYGYREAAGVLANYARDLHFTHVQLMPVSEHPLDESWGYQTTGYFAPTSRFGSPDDFRAFVDRMHAEGIGVIVDWVPAHFPRDDWALARYDGTPLFEHEDPRLGSHPDWGTLIFNYGRNEVRGFLLSSALCWLDEFHVDGLRVDAVASMLYLDYSRKEGEWVPNRHGGRENLDAIEFLRELNVLVHERHPGALTIAEESTAWPMVSRPTYLGGLGFSLKWNMGWMNDTLRYMEDDPIHRRYHHDMLTFSQLYAYTENFVLPLSHDEVVHGKHSLLDKMPGDPWRKFANLRLLLTYQATHPGKKLLFMGGEFGQGEEWNATRELAWSLLDVPWHAGICAAVKDLNSLYSSLPALHARDFEHSGFDWIDCNDADASVLTFIRHGGGQFVVVILNFTPVPRYAYHIGVPEAGRYLEIFNGDSALYGGSNLGNGGAIETVDEPHLGRQHSMYVLAPPLAGVILIPERFA